MQLVPADLKEDFTVKDFAMAAGVRLSELYIHGQLI